MKNSVFTAIILLGLMFWGCEQENPLEMNPAFDDQEIEVKSLGIENLGSETGSLSGNVFFAGCQIPVPGVSVTIGDNCAISGPDGSYTLEDIPAGVHSLVACREDFESCSKEVVISECVEKKLAVYVTSKQFSTQVNGQVTGDFTGKAMSDLKVVVLNPDESESGLKAVTGFNGSYSITPVPQGERTVVVKMNNEEIYRQEIQLDDIEQEFNIIVPEAFEFTDNRDGHSYLAMRIGNQTWMAENLAFLPFVNPSADQSLKDPKYYVYGYDGSSFEEAASLDNFRDYGVLYNWAAAAKACPDGWHLPTDKEWKVLEKDMGMSEIDASRPSWRISGEAGKKLKSAEGWINEGNGDNGSGFNAMPAGLRNGKKFIYQGDTGYFWTRTPESQTNSVGRALIHSNDWVYRLFANNSMGFSVRCIKDVKKISQNDDVGPK